VTGVVFLGSVQQIEARLDSGAVAVAQVSNDSAVFAPGDRVSLSWSAADELRFSE
jgi:hypothetical protein